VSNNRYLKTWVVPKTVIQTFTDTVNWGGDHFYLDSVVPYDDNHFLVVTSGLYCSTYVDLENILKNL